MASWALFMALGASAALLLLQTRTATSLAAIVRLENDFPGGPTRLAILPHKFGYLMHSGEHVTVSAGNHSEVVLIYAVEPEMSIGDLQSRFGLTESQRSDLHAPVVVALASVRDSSFCAEDHKPCLGTIRFQARPIFTYLRMLFRNPH